MKKTISAELLFRLYITEMRSLKDVSDQLGISIGSLAYLLNKYGISKRDTKTPKVSGITRTDLFDALYVERLTNAEIMKKFGICESTIRKLCKHFGIPKRWEKLRSERTRFYDQIIDMYTNKHMSLTAIKKEIDLPKSAIRRILLNAGLSLRNRHECQNTKHYDTGIKWMPPTNTLRKRCRAFFSNHIVPLYKKSECECCHSTENLCVHHKVPFSVVIHQILSDNEDLDIFRDEDELYDIIVHDKRFLDPTNLLTVCEFCHYTIFHPEAEYKKLRQSAAKP